MSLEGVDYSDPNVSPAGLRDAGKHFAGRYLGAGGSAKHLTPNEARELAANGLTIMSLVEGAATDAMVGYALGRQHAQSAVLAAAGVGMPADRPFYFAVDWDVTAAQWPAVQEYFAGAQSILTTERLGIYGGLNAITWAFRDRIASWFFQTYAWSHGQWSPAAHVQQYHNGVSLAGGDVDLCRAMVAEFGQWQPNGGTPPNGGGSVSTTGQEVWSFGIGSPSLGVSNWQAGDWLKYAYEAYLGTQEIKQALAAPAEPPSDLALVAAIRGLTASVDGLAAKVDELAARPPLDAVAFAQALATHPDVVQALATAVAGQLGSIGGEITLSGSLSGRIAAPAS